MRTLLAQLSWTNDLLILQGTKTIEEKEFYIRLCIKYNYSALDGIVIDKKTTDEPTKRLTRTGCKIIKASVLTKFN